MMWQVVSGLMIAAVLMQPGAAAEEHAAGGQAMSSEGSQLNLPDPLRFEDGRDVKTVEQWQARREEILELFREHVYGRRPAAPEAMTFEVLSEVETFGGKAVKKTARVNFFGDPSSPSMKIYMVLPAKREGPVPMFVGVHLYYSPLDEPNPSASLAAQPSMQDAGALPGELDLEALPEAGIAEVILDRGYGFATIDAEELATDDPARFDEPLISAFYEAGQTEPVDDAWGALGAWAWGLNRAMDYFQMDPDVDGDRVIAIGHSRMGKAALWAGATDPRFAMVISNSSGCGGAALSRRRHGETVAIINDAFPHWFCRNFRQYSDNEGALPVDQHLLVAAIAPRPVYIASAQEDDWADPRGEYLAGFYATPVYELYGLEGLPAVEATPMNESIGETVGYHIRSGAHDLTDYDWLFYLDFADRHLKK